MTQPYDENRAERDTPAPPQQPADSSGTWTAGPSEPASAPRPGESAWGAAPQGGPPQGGAPQGASAVAWSTGPEAHQALSSPAAGPAHAADPGYAVDTGYAADPGYGGKPGYGADAASGAGAGYGAGSGPGPGPGTAAGRADSTNFFAALFDFRFQHFITVKFSAVLYVVAILVALLLWLGNILSGVMWGITIAQSPFIGDGGFNAVPLLLAIFLGWIPSFLALIVFRLVLEFAVATVRTAQYTGQLAERDTRS